MTWSARIQTALDERRQADAFRQRRPNAGGNGRWIALDDRRYLNFSGNDYLGLSQREEVIAAWQQGAARYGVGSGGSGHVTGFTHAHHELEQQLADWQGYPRALLFISGFAANQAVVAAMMQADDRILADKLRRPFSLRRSCGVLPTISRRRWRVCLKNRRWVKP
jgi:8-amino-7-oxononanoate synthase